MMQALWSNPGLPLSGTPFARACASASELVERATRRYPKPPFALSSTLIEGREVGVREVPVLRTPFCDLLHFERDTPRADPKVLIVAPLSGHHASLLRDTVQRLLPDHDLYITDWTDARLIPLSAGHFDLDDYIELVQRFLRELGRDVHVIAVCQPAVPVLAAIALMAEDEDAAVPRTMTLMAGPVDARVSQTQVGKLATDRALEWFERNAVHRVRWASRASCARCIRASCSSLRSSPWIPNGTPIRTRNSAAIYSPATRTARTSTAASTTTIWR